MKFQYNDGGRLEAGFNLKNVDRSHDCVARAITIATEKPYAQVHAGLNAIALRERSGKRKRGKSNADKGVFRFTYQRYLESIGWKWTPTMHIGSGCTVHLRDGELPMGRLIVCVSKHMVAVIDGVIHDRFDPSRNGTRCVYGYFTKA